MPDKSIVTLLSEPIPVQIGMRVHTPTGSSTTYLPDLPTCQRLKLSGLLTLYFLKPGSYTTEQ